MSAAATIPDSAPPPDIEAAFSAWLDVPPPSRRDAEAEAVAERLLADFQDDRVPARLRQIITGENFVEIARHAMRTSEEKAHRVAYLDGDHSIAFAFQPIEGAPGAGRTLLIRRQRIPNLFELTSAHRIHRRALVSRIETLCRGLHHAGQNRGRGGEAYAALRVARRIFMPGLLTGVCPAPPRPPAEKPADAPAAPAGACISTAEDGRVAPETAPVEAAGAAGDAFDALRRSIESGRL